MNTIQVVVPEITQLPNLSFTVKIGESSYLSGPEYIDGQWVWRTEATAKRAAERYVSDTAERATRSSMVINRVPETEETRMARIYKYAVEFVPFRKLSQMATHS